MPDTYYPPEIPDNALGTIEQSGTDTTNNTYTTKVYTPVSEVDKNYPSRIVAHETLSQTLDTRTKKIKGEYSFSKEGAITVGGYVAGESGEISISPDGIVAKNVNGENTVAIDGTTGDATFKGQVKAGSFISDGDVTIRGTGAYVVDDGTYNVLRLGYFSGGL